ncbi:MAG: peptide-methionine (R)-S-oxide reductase MsrB [Candidatus Jacksonbacteria bacterium]|nr:peptide-methionine (R)-S-oxide reductase MsrB [Candidatus Jacksonbacteria bacterium]
MSNNKKIALISFILLIAAGFIIYKIENKGRNTITKINTAVTSENTAIAYFAGGCFWCIESDFEKLPGVIESISGYMGGTEQQPSYEQVAAGSTSHRESIKVLYDSTQHSYEELVLYYFRHVDPTDDSGSFYDRGNQYAPAIYYQTAEEKTAIEKVIKNLQKQMVYKKPIVVDIQKADEFWQAEDYHQDYYKKNPLRYKHYRTGSGRDSYLESIWGNTDSMPQDENTKPVASSPTNNRWQRYTKPSQEELKRTLEPLQYNVTQEEGTETPFKNEYNSNEAAGIYVDILSGEPLFSSTHKYKSGTGWPSFWQPIDEQFIVKKKDFFLIFPRTEIRSRYSDSHIGHVFDDGPDPTGLRYCMNSAAMRFVAKENMQKEGYSEYLSLFE